ncbi:MAG TPA: SoxY-related AACIE arm protein [Microvirga sp.]|jgi:sulfur-oxidizing protein SoxY|nr:SoxY-related AACIE arm protein [Microvirga sp.]
MNLSPSPAAGTRRAFLTRAAGFAAAPLLLTAWSGRAAATPEAMAAAIRLFTGGAAPRPGGIRLDLPPLVENGNSVPLTVSVESAMSATDFVRRIAVFNEKNPQPHVAVFHLTPRSGRAQVTTRIRLADSQVVVAIAELGDGTFRTARADVIVTLAACIES